MTTPIPMPPDNYNKAQMNNILTVIRQRLEALEQPAHAGYQVTNPPASLRTIDGTSGTTDQVRQVLVTMIKDFKNKGGLSK